MELNPRIEGANASWAESIRRTSFLKAMYDRDLTYSEIRAKVGPYIRNGNELNCVGEDNDDFGGVERANIGSTSMIDHGMESNDRQEMDQEWNQVFVLLEQVGLTNKVSEFGILNHSHKRIPPGLLTCSKVPPNLINHTGSVRSALCNRPYKDTTKSYYHLSGSCDSGKQTHISNDAIKSL